MNIQHEPRRLSSDSTKTPSNKTTSQTNSSSSPSTNSSSTTAESTTLLSQIISIAAQTAQQSLDRLKRGTASNLQKTESFRESIAKSINAVSKERIHRQSNAAESKSSVMDSLRRRVRNSAVDTMNQSSNYIKGAVSDAAKSGTEKIKTVFIDNTKRSVVDLSNNTMKKLQSNLSQQTSSAANLAKKATSQAANTLTSQIQEYTSKASSWLWWWGLAAVGVYGMSTTLTKEGVEAVKDLFRSNDDDRNDSRNNVPLSENSSSTADNASSMAFGTDNANGEETIVGRTTSWLSWFKTYYAGSDKKDG